MAIVLGEPFTADREPPTRRPGDFYRNKQGTPYVSVPDGHLVKRKRKDDLDRVATTPYSRPSGFGKIIEDMYSIHKWDQRQQAYGFAIAPELMERAKVLTEIADRESQQWKDEADKIVKAAKIAAKSALAADRGSHAHGLAEDDDEGRDIVSRIEAGEDLGMPAGVQRSLVDAWREMLARDGLEILAVEMPVVNDIYRTAGTLDRVARLTKPLRFVLCTGEVVVLPVGLVVILDIKSGKRRLRDNGTVMYWHGYAVQVFLYGPTARPYDTETDTRGEWQWEVDGRWALIAHLDVLGAIAGSPSCDLILVDLEAGRRAADLCVAAKQWAADSAVFSVAQLDVEGDGVGTSVVAGIAVPQGFDSPPAATPSTPTPMATSGEVDGPRAAATVDPCEGLGSVVAQDADSSASHPNTRPDDDFNAPIPLASGAAPSASLPRTESLGRVGGARAATPTPTLTVNADEGGTAHLDEAFDALEAQYAALEPGSRAWIKALTSQAMQAGVSFHSHGNRSERRWWLIKALVTLSLAHLAEDEVLRALMALSLGTDAPLFAAITAGYALGAHGSVEAQRLAGLADALVAGQLVGGIDDGGVFVVRTAAA